MAIAKVGLKTSSLGLASPPDSFLTLLLTLAKICESKLVALKLMNSDSGRLLRSVEIWRVLTGARQDSKKLLSMKSLSLKSCWSSSRINWSFVRSSFTEEHSTVGAFALETC